MYKPDLHRIRGRKQRCGQTEGSKDTRGGGRASPRAGEWTEGAAGSLAPALPVWAWSLRRTRGRGVPGKERGVASGLSRADTPMAGSTVAAGPRGLSVLCELQAEPEQPAALPPPPPPSPNAPQGVPSARATPGPPSRTDRIEGAGPRLWFLEEGRPRADSPAGAAVAVEVPEVPEGAPKLKAMSRDQHLDGPGLARRDAQCPLLFRPAGKRQAIRTISSVSFRA